MLSGTDAGVKNFNNTFDKLLQDFRDRATRGTLVTVYRIWEHVESLREAFSNHSESVPPDVHGTAADLDINSMPYAAGAGLDTRKLCLEGTRSGILGEITDWINDVDDNTRIFWLHGTAGSGKSTIAHTIANRFKRLGRLGSIFCFDRNRTAERQEKIFTNIAQDLANCDTLLRTALAAAIRHNTSLKNTTDILQQWEEMIVKPARARSGAMVGPIVIVIDALDESGDRDSRRYLLRILANAEGHITNLPPHFRILVVSRTLQDMNDAFKGVTHVQRKDMNNIPSTEDDIFHYVSHDLSDAELEDTLQQDSVRGLAHKAGGLFEWARLACAYVKGENVAGVGFTVEERFTAVMTHNKDVPLLDGMYRLTLETIFPQGQHMRDIRIQRFKSVMAQILGTMEPLPLASLDAMRCRFLDDMKIDIRTIVCPMGALLSGTTDSPDPVRALHASFPDFLMHRRSGEFFVDLQPVYNNLTFSCLGVMKDQLRFNICKLPSSYLPNSNVPDLNNLIKKYISPELAYSCQFWTVHVCDARLNEPLVEAVGRLLNGVELLFWFEVLSLLAAIHTCARSLSSLMRWLMARVRELVLCVVCVLRHISPKEVIKES
jgi:hypothetical protein